MTAQPIKCVEFCPICHKKLVPGKYSPGWSYSCNTAADLIFENSSLLHYVIETEYSLSQTSQANNSAKIIYIAYGMYSTITNIRGNKSTVRLDDKYGYVTVPGITIDYSHPWDEYIKNILLL